MLLREVVVECWCCDKVSVGHGAWHWEPYWDHLYDEADREATICPDCLDELEIEELQGK